MEKETKAQKTTINKKPIIISICSTLLAIVIICTTLLLIFSNKTDENEIYMFSKNLVAVKLDDGWGYVNQKGEVVIKGQFGEANPFAENGLALVAIDGHYGYINTEGKFEINPIYSQAKSFTEDSSLVLVKRNSKYGYINSKGEEVIPCQFEEAYSFSNGLALVGVGGKYGYINEKGKFVINPIYDYAESFVNDKLAVVGKENNSELIYACVSSKGELLTDFMLDEVYVSEDYVITFDGVYYGLCDLKLNPLFKTNYQIAGFPIDINSFKNLDDELIPFKDTETYKYGYLNISGQIVIEAKYDIIGNFYNDLAMVKFDNKYGFINTQGQLIVNNEYDITRNYNESFAVVGKDIDGEMTYGLVNSLGNIVIELKYFDLGDVNNGLSYFTTFDNELVGYVDTSDKVVIPQAYSFISKSIVAYDFTDDGYAVVKQDSLYGILNTKGEYVVNPYLLAVNY